MDIGIVLLVVEKDMVVVDNWLTVLPVLVPGKDLERHSLGRGILDEFNLLALSVKLRHFLGVLDVISRVNVPELNVLAVEDPPSLNGLDVFQVVVVILLDSLLECFHPLFSYFKLLRRHWLLAFVSVFFSGLDQLYLAPHFFNGIIT